MTIFKHELRQGRKSFLIWTTAIAFLLVICIFIYPEMTGDMESMGDMFSSMGAFTEAFGMDKLNFATFPGFYAIECGNVLGLGGAFFAALIAVAALAKEEKDRTAEFLLSHPVSRVRVVTEKLAAVMLQILLMNLFVYLCAIAATAAIGEDIPWKALTLLHLAYWLVQMELAGICFGVSAFLSQGSLGVGLGLAALMYFLNIIANIADSANFLKYITPYGYAEGADIVSGGTLDAPRICIGMAYMLLCIAAAYFRYCKKDIR